MRRFVKYYEYLFSPSTAAALPTQITTYIILLLCPINLIKASLFEAWTERPWPLTAQ